MNEQNPLYPWTNPGHARTADHRSIIEKIEDWVKASHDDIMEMLFSHPPDQADPTSKTWPYVTVLDCVRRSTRTSSIFAAPISGRHWVNNIIDFKRREMGLPPHGIPTRIPPGTQPSGPPHQSSEAVLAELERARHEPPAYNRGSNMCLRLLADAELEIPVDRPAPALGPCDRAMRILYDYMFEWIGFVGMFTHSDILYAADALQIPHESTVGKHTWAGPDVLPGIVRSAVSTVLRKRFYHRGMISMSTGPVEGNSHELRVELADFVRSLMDHYGFTDEDITPRSMVRRYIAASLHYREMIRQIEDNKIWGPHSGRIERTQILLSRLDSTVVDLDAEDAAGRRAKPSDVYEMPNSAIDEIWDGICR